MQTAWEGNPPSQPVLFRQASDAYEAKDYPRALTLIDQALEIAPDDANHWNAKGVFLRVMGRLAEAVLCYRHALELTPDGSGCWSNLGNVLKDLKHDQSAIQCHARATTHPIRAVARRIAGCDYVTT